MNLLNQSIIKHKMGLLNLAEELRNVSQACRVMGVSRDTFYRVKEAKESGGLEALLHKDRRRANLKNRVDEAVEQAITAFALENPAAGQVRVSNELRKRGIHVSPTGVRSVWLRHRLHTFRLRLAALEKKASEVVKIVRCGLPKVLPDGGPRKAIDGLFKAFAISRKDEAVTLKATLTGDEARKLVPIARDKTKP